MKSVDEEFPLKDGYVRVYEDHTGSCYKDYTQKEYDEAFNSIEMQIFRNIIQEEIDNEIIQKMKQYENI